MSTDDPKLSRAEVDAVLATKTAPRITEASIKDRIATVDYVAHKHLTICIIEMVNGFIVTGVSAPASKANFDADVGKHYAFENAFKQLWQLEGYLLREKLFLGEVK
jgi:hypothetical protein